jgi:hypothetical protein
MAYSVACALVGCKACARAFPRMRGHPGALSEPVEVYADSMRTIELWRWRLRDHRGKVILTRAHMTLDEALARDAGAMPEPGTRELREVPESAAELAALSPGKGIRSGLPARGWWRQPVPFIPARLR